MFNKLNIRRFNKRKYIENHKNIKKNQQYKKT